MIAIEGKRLALTSVSSGEGKRGSFRGYPGCETGCEEACPYISAFLEDNGNREPAGSGTPVLTVSVSYAMSIADISPDMFLPCPMEL
jgi:hypothetical protein